MYRLSASIMRAMPLDRKLSTLERTVLGVVWKRGPCTGYAVVMEFAGSAGSAYRSGASSVYPLLNRLEKAGLLASKRSEKRGEKQYEITEEGLGVLRDWFVLSPAGDDFTCALDVLRSRTYFLKALTKEERDCFFEQALAGLKRLLAQCEAVVREYEIKGDPYSVMAMTGAVYETKARIKWLQRCRDASKKLIEDRENPTAQR